MLNVDDERFLDKYIQKAKVLIVDKVKLSRSRLIKALEIIGAQLVNIQECSSFHDAINLQSQHQFQLIFSDYSIQGGSGFELFRLFRENNTFDKKTLLVMMTSNLSQSPVARAAEDGVDSFILKPYVLGFLKKTIIDSLKLKLFPPQYLVELKKGSDLLNEKKYQDALVYFDNAKNENSKSALVNYFSGQAYEGLKQEEVALDVYKKGYALNKLQFKNQMALYQLLKKLNRNHDAYEILKRIATYFPSSPERLQQIIKLAIQTENYFDIDGYYRIFLQFDEMDPLTTKYVCAGMYILGKYKTLQGQTIEALEVFDRIGNICSGDVKLVRSIIELLVQKKLELQAKKYLRFIDSTPINNIDHQCCVLFSSYLDMDSNACVDQIIYLHQQGDRSYTLFKILFEILKKSSVTLDQPKLQLLMEEGSRLHHFELT
jgi:two-component system, chemotaxis family, chemotaxis protein CheY